MTNLFTGLTRVTHSTRLIPEIDGLRCVAIMAVMLHHLLGVVSIRTYGIWPPPDSQHNFFLSLIVHGHFGVPLFFVISGFILSLPFAESLLNSSPGLGLRKYYLRRVTRLEPPYFFNLCFLFCAAILLGKVSWSDWKHLLASLTYTHNIFYAIQSTVNGVAWSLEVEIQFYVLAPLLSWVFAIKQPAFRRVILVSAILFGALVSEYMLPSGVDRWNGDRWRMSLVNYFHYFLTGFLLSDLYLNGFAKQSAGVRVFLWDGIGLAAWVGIAIIICGDSTLRLILPLLALAAYISVFKGKFFRAILRAQAVYIVGGMCYTLYLWHQPILFAWGKFGMPCTWIPSLGFGSNFVVQSTIAVALVLLAGAFLFAFLERPFMKHKWYRRMFSKQNRADSEPNLVNA